MSSTVKKNLDAPYFYLPQVVILYASVSADHIAKGRTEDLQRLLSTKGVPFSLLDATQDVNRDLRNALFAVSGKRAVYPQVFLKAVASADQPPSFTFAGLAEEIQELADEDAKVGGFTARFGALMKKTGGGSSPAVTHVDAGNVGVSAEQTRAGTSAPATVVAAVAAPAAAVLPPSQPAPLLAPGRTWTRHVDRRSGDPYWWCAATRESSWVDPTSEAAAGVWVRLDARGRPYYYNWQTGISTWTPPNNTH